MSSDWKTMLLGDFIELKRGYDLPKQQRILGSVPLISSAGLSDHHSEAKVKGPGVVTGRYGTIGQVFYVEDDFWPLNTTLYVRDFKGNNPAFVYYFLKTIDYLQYSDKAAVPGVNRNHLHMASVCVPTSIDEQQKIASLLSALDKKIQLNQQINQTLEQMAQAIFKSWFVDFDPVKAKIAAFEADGSEDDALLAAMQAISGKDPQQLTQLQTENPEHYATLRATAELFPAAMQESELWEIPEGWVVSQIGDEVTVVGGGTPSTKNAEFWEGGAINWTTPKDLSNVADKVLIGTDRMITQAGLKKISSGLLPVDTVLMSSRAPVGYLVLAKTPIAINQGYIAMKCGKTLSPEFVIQWCSTNMDEIKNRASGTTFAEISKKSFNVIPVLVPPLNLVSTYSKYVKQTYLKIEMNVRENKSLAELRDTLLPKLLSGELAIIDAE